MPTLESLQAVHDGAPSRKARDRARARARELAAKLGVDVPAWAVQRRNGSLPRLPEERGAFDHAPPATPIEIPPALSAWRAAAPGRVVNLRRDGSVRLIVLGFGGAHQEAAFTNARMAERALLLGVTWRPKTLAAGQGSSHHPLAGEGRSGAQRPERAGSDCGAL